MKASTVLALFLAVESVTAFSIVPARTRQTTFALRYTVIEGLDEEDDKDAEDGGIRSRIGKDANPNDLSNYRDYDEMSDENILNVDSFQNRAGGGIIPGFNLSALCGDD
jgi:hypothetical protein